MLVIVNNVFAFMYDENKQTLLDALEDQGIRLEYNCRSGYCGACRVKLIEGEVAYKSQPLAFIHHDEILACSAVPQGQHIHIEIDEELLRNK